MCFLACPSFGAVLETMQHAKRLLGEVLSAVEFLDQESLRLVLSQLQARARGAAGRAAFRRRG